MRMKCFHFFFFFFFLVHSCVIHRTYELFVPLNRVHIHTDLNDTIRTEAASHTEQQQRIQRKMTHDKSVWEREREEEWEMGKEKYSSYMHRISRRQSVGKLIRSIQPEPSIRNIKKSSREKRRRKKAPKNITLRDDEGNTIKIYYYSLYGTICNLNANFCLFGFLFICRGRCRLLTESRVPDKVGNTYSVHTHYTYE